MRRFLTAGGIALGLLVTACTPATGPAPGFSIPSVPSSTSPGTPGTEAAPTTTTSGGGGSAPESPDTTESGEDVPGYVSAQARAETAASQAAGGQFGTEEFGLTMRDLTTRAEEVESLISVCMAEAGFEYIPVDFTTIRQAMVSDKSAPGLSGSEYLSQYGHGISTQEEKPIVEIGLGDQNRRILDGLSDPDQVAYTRTLWGDNDDATFASVLESEAFSRTGGFT